MLLVAARKTERLSMSLAALYDKLKHSEPAVLRGLVRGSPKGRLRRPRCWMIEPVCRGGCCAWSTANLPASEKRLQPLRVHRGTALPGHSLVVFDPDRGLVCVVACEDARESERVGFSQGRKRPERAAVDRDWSPTPSRKAWAESGQDLSCASMRVIRT